jgi:HEAT repeat protein
MEPKFTLKKIKALGSLHEALPMLSTMKLMKSVDAQKALLHVIKHDNIDIRIHGLKTLQKVGNKEALPALITALSKAKDPVTGSEEATIHEIYLKNLVKAISEITGEAYEIDNVNDVNEIKALIKKIKSRPEA